MKQRSCISFCASAVLMIGATVLTTGSNTASACGPEFDNFRRPVDLVICLDTSGSMNGLIDSARQKLWAIVNDVALAKPIPDLRVALITFGNTSHSAANGWVRVDTDFTRDLDLVSEKLFALRTNGGTEYVGRALLSAHQLQWHPSTDSLKIVVIAGNESADQDQQSPFRNVCTSLSARGIFVNSIYCGPADNSIAPAWREVAHLAGGAFASIDQNRGTVIVETPFDDQLGVLSAQLNTTYLPFGVHGRRASLNQVMQDNNAVSLNSAAVASRSGTKISSNYFNYAWDLVDACDTKSFDLRAIADKDLPEVMRPMTMGQRIEYVADNRKQREAIKAKIRQLTSQREAYVDAEMRKLALDDSGSFDNAIRTAIRQQAKARGFTFVDETTVVAPSN